MYGIWISNIIFSSDLYLPVDMVDYLEFSFRLFINISAVTNLFDNKCISSLDILMLPFYKLLKYQLLHYFVNIRKTTRKLRFHGNDKNIDYCWLVIYRYF